MSVFRYALLCCLFYLPAAAQAPVDLHGYNNKSGVKAQAANGLITLTWPAGSGRHARMVLDLKAERPLIKSLGWQAGNSWRQIASGLDPVFS